MENKSNNRIEYIDVFRSFGIILMVMGHVYFGKEFDHFIHGFHMPMFFFITGFLYKDKTVAFAGFLKRKAKALLLPYVIFGALHLLIRSLMLGEFPVRSLKALLLFPNGGSFPIATSLWFLIALFLADVIYFWINKIANCRVKWIVVIAVALTGQLLPAYTKIMLPFALDPAFVGVGLMHIGRTLRRFESRIVGMKWYQLLFFGALTAFSIFRSDPVNMRTNVYPGAFILFWVNAVAACVVGACLANKTDLLLKNSFAGRYLRSVGRNSVIYVIFNQLTIIGCSGLLSRAAAFPTPVFKALVLVLTMAILFLLSVLFEKTFFKVLIGRF